MMIFQRASGVSYPQSGYQAPAGPNQPQNGLGLAALIVGIASIPIACCTWGFGGIALAIVAIVLGFLGMKKARQGFATNEAQARAGLTCGIVGVVWGLVVVVLGAIGRSIMG